MLFNSTEFLLFFPIVTILYFLLPHKFRWFHLLLASCFFYAAFIPVYILILFFTIIIDYLAGILIENSEGKRRRLFLAMSIIANVGVLAFFKYFNFFIDNTNTLLHALHISYTPIVPLNIILPIGLSFHTFQAMSYTIEVYRGHQKAERHFGIYSLYVMFYPQLVAGPIERPQNLLHQFYEKHSLSQENISSGLRLMLWGFFKKVVIADRLALLTAPVFNHPHDFPSVTLLMGTFFFSFQIYCDFSGYSDIAIGAARVMGFTLMKNFNSPYQSRSISEFWSRWHISLSTWFRDYLYISLGGNRVIVPRWYLNLFIVFCVSGLWHGANWTFILWGALHGFYLVFAIMTGSWRGKLFNIKVLQRLRGIDVGLQILTTFTLVMIAWVFFRANNISDAFYIVSKLPSALKDILHAVKTQQIWLGHIEKFISVSDILFGFVLIIVLEAIQVLQKNGLLIRVLQSQSVWKRMLLYYLVLMVIVLFGEFKNNQQFIYFQF